MAARRMPTLDDVAGSGAAALPTEGRVVLTADGLPRIPAEMETDRIVGLRYFDEGWAPVLVFQRPAARMLGLALASQLLHYHPKEVRLHLRHRASEIGAILLNVQAAQYTGLHAFVVLPHRLAYHVSEVERFTYQRERPECTPWFAMTNHRGSVDTLEDWLAVDVLRISGEGADLAWLATLLMDFGNPQCTMPRTTLNQGSTAQREVHLRVPCSESHHWCEDYWAPPSSDDASG